IRTINTTNHRRNRDLGNITPALSIEEVEHELGQTLPGNRRSRRNSVDSRRSRRRSASPSRDTINTNTNNPDAMNPETSTLQPPPYGATDEAQNISLRLAHANFPEMNQSHVVSSHKLESLDAIASPFRESSGALTCILTSDGSESRSISSLIELEEVVIIFTLVSDKT
ncbi:17345_t:CDS:2, partial [Dentiscutata heterogama]